MRFPSLIRKQFCKQPIWLTLYGEGLDENGAPVVVYDRRELFPSDTLKPSDTLYGEPLYCNFQEKVKTILTSEKKKVQANGVLLIPRDIIPSAATISGGYAVINGVKRDIVQGIKARNPDGTVNFIELDVI